MRRVRGLLGACHPGPTAVVTAVAVLLGVAVGLPAAAVLVSGLVVLTGQLSIGWSNDWIDAGRDTRVGRTDKPVATGGVSVDAVAVAAFSAAAVSLIIAIGVGLGAAVLNVLLLASAWAYNAGVKRTALSFVPFIISFGILPSLVTFTSPTPRFAPWWASVAGAALGVAAHLTNVLPDLADDRATGIRGLAHRIGPRSAGISAFAVLTVAALVLAFGPGRPGSIALVLLIVDVLLAVAGIGLVARGRRDRILMRIVMGAAITDVALLVVAGAAITA